MVLSMHTMRLRAAVTVLAVCLQLMSTPAAQADSSSPALASYYERHMALQGDVAYGWVGRGQPQRLRAGVVQVGVGRDTWFALTADGALLAWTDAPERATLLMRGVKRFAAGASGWFAIDAAGVLWHGTGNAAPQRIADDVVDACIGDSADYYVTRDGALFVKGLAHRGQYGDGKLSASPGFVATARDAVAVRAHTGHAIHLRRDGVVMGTGGNRYGPLGAHGLGDKADRWGRVFDEAGQMLGIAGRRERTGHREQHDGLALEELVGAEVLRAILGHRLERARGHPLAGFDRHVLISGGWYEVAKSSPNARARSPGPRVAS